MTVIEKNTGTKIPYEVVKNKICFDDDLTINLAKREDDRDVHIDVCYDADGELVIGAAAGRSYVAEIDIPARRYTQPEPIEEVTADGSSTYAAPASGDLTAGLHPATATSGGTSGGGLVAEESGLGVSYIAKVCGSAPGMNF